MLVVKGNGKAGMIANAKRHLLGIQVFHRQGMVDGIPFQGEGGHQAEFIREFFQCLRTAANFQHNGIRRLIHKVMLHQPDKAMLGRLEGLTLCLDHAVHNLTRMGEQNRRVEAPDGLVRLPHMLHAVAFADDALQLGAVGGDCDLQIFIFDRIVHGSSSYIPSGREGLFFPLLPLGHRQLIAAVVFWIFRVTLDPMVMHLMLLGQIQQGFP